MAFTKSRQPRKQRKARYSAPLHERQKLAHAHIAKEARKKLGTKKRSAAVRTGDKVRITRGKFRGHSGKVSSVDLKDLKVYVEGAVARKAKGAEVLVPIEPSNVVILEMNMSDKKRKELLERNREEGQESRKAGEGRSPPAAV